MIGLHKTVADALRAVPKLPVDEWLLKHVRIERGNIPGPFDVGNSPWIREPLEQLRNNSVRSIFCACSVQSAKTEMVNGGMLYTIAEEGGDMGTFTQTDDTAHRFLDKRFKLHILNCEPVRAKLMKDDRSIQKQTVDFVHMVQYVFGTANIHNCQSLPLRTVWGDECAYWEEGRIGEVEKRTTSFDKLRKSKRVFISTPLDNEGEFYERFMSGSRSEWHVRCPECNHGQKLMWKQMKWNGEKARREDGTYNLQIIKDSIRYECEGCQAEWTDTPVLRRKLSASGYYVDENTNPDPEVKSYHWSSLTVDWVAWYKVVVEFLQARAAQKLGDYGPIAEWTRKRLGEFFSPRDLHMEEVNLSGGLPMEEAWDKEHRRYLTVDPGKMGFTVCVRLWAQNGASRLYHIDRVQTWEQIRDLQVKCNVTDRRVFVDCGFDTNESLRQCAKYGWMGTKGDKTQFFNWYKTDPASGQKKAIQRPYSMPRKIDTSLGLKTEDRKAMLRAGGAHAQMILFSTDYIKLILHRLRAGHGAPWETASNAPPWYFTELTGETLETETDKKTGRIKRFFKRWGANHSFDTEVLQVLAACIEKLLGQAEIVTGEDENPVEE